MPPDAAATYIVAGSRGSTSMSCTRPPVAAGPTERKRSESKGDWAASVAATSSEAKARRMDVGRGDARICQLCRVFVRPCRRGHVLAGEGAAGPQDSETRRIVRIDIGERQEPSWDGVAPD